MSMRVLVADDSRTMRKILVRMLQKLEVDETIEAVDGNHALVLFELNEFDLVVTDWMMPGMSGLDLLKQIRGKGSDTPVVMLTTVADREQIMSAINAGASEYLLKPFNSKQQEKLIALCQQVQDHSYTPRCRNSINVHISIPLSAR